MRNIHETYRRFCSTRYYYVSTNITVTFCTRLRFIWFLLIFTTRERLGLLDTHARFTDVARVFVFSLSTTANVKQHIVFSAKAHSFAVIGRINIRETE